MLKIACGVLAGVVMIVSGGAATLAAPSQDRPGQPTQGKVWIENRGTHEAIPVVGVVTLASGEPLAARLVRQPWEYRTLALAAGQDAASILNGPGLEGWEVVGLQGSDPPRSTLLLKRPR